MGGGAGAAATTKAPRTTASDGNGDGASSRRAPVPPVEQQQQKPEPEPLPAASADGSAAAQSCGEDGEDDEQVERFYALLANIRALRGLYSAGDGGGSGSAAAAGRGRKRTREPEAPWKPTFRLEDFEEEVNQGTASARRAGVNQGTSGGVASRPAVDDDHGEDGVAEVASGGNKLGRRVAARG